MILFKKLFSLIFSAPELIKLFLIIDKRIRDEEEEIKVKDDIKAVSDAFKNKDASKLRDIFNNK